jgi:hypothetical protein
VSCPSTADGDDGLCGRHRALQNNDIEAWRASQLDWRGDLFADFSARHKEDSWGAFIAASYQVEHKEDRGEFNRLLREMLRKAPGKKLPYNPAASAAEIESGTDLDGHTSADAAKERARKAVEAYYERRGAR